MTPSDRDPNTPGPANPFDTGLPMVRMPPPAESKGKRKRKRQAGRVIGRNIDAARVEPAVIDSAGPAGEPIPPLPVPERSRPTGDWAQWLEPGAATARSAERTSAGERAWAGERAPTGVGGSAAGAPADHVYEDWDVRDDHSGDNHSVDSYSDANYDDESGSTADVFDELDLTGRAAADHDAAGHGPGDRADHDPDDAHSLDADVVDRRFDRRYSAANIFDENEPGEPKPLPSLIDRTGGSPGPSLRRPRPQGGDTDSRNDRMLAVLVVVGVLIAVGSIVWAVLPGSPPEQRADQPPVEQATVTPAPTTLAPEAAAVATPGCEQRNSADVVSGTQPGGTTDGPSAILAFEHAYYVLRSGAAARAVVTPDSAVPDAAQIQRGIDQVPVGTRYCVHITKAQPPSTDGLTRWEVRLTQQYPDEEPKTFLQSIATRSHTGKTLIESISMA